MKWFLILISFNCLAQYEVLVKKSGITKNHATFNNLNDANSWVLDNEKPVGNGFNSFGRISPKDYSIEIIDITSEVEAAESAKQLRDSDIAAIKAINIDMIQGASPEVKQILKRLVQELR